MSYSMKTNIKKLPNSQIEIDFDIPSEEFEEYYQKALSNLSKDVKMPGFRPGKVPLDILEKSLNEGAVLDTAAELAVKEKYVQAILEQKLEVLGKPDIQVLKIKGVD